MTKPSAADMSNEFVEVRRQYRGVEYVLRELPMDQYDKTIEMATTKGEDGREKFDGAGHTKILLVKSLVQPKLKADELFGKGTRLVRNLQEALQELYFDEEPDELQKLQDREEKESATDDEGEAPAAT